MMMQTGTCPLTGHNDPSLLRHVWMQSGAKGASPWIAFLVTALVILPFAFGQGPPNCEISGAVIDDSGPVKDAVVALRSTTIGTTGVPDVRTDRNGRYTLKGITPGRYTVSVGKKENRSVPQPRTVTLADGMRLRVDFRYAKGGVISGRVLNRERQPVEGVIVTALAKTMGDGGLRLAEEGGDRTNDLGEFRIPYLPDGSYIVAVNALPVAIKKRKPGLSSIPGNGYPPVTFYPATRTPDSAAALDIRSGDDRLGIEITVQKETTRCVSFTIGVGWGAGIGASLEERLAAKPVRFAEGSLTGGVPYEVCGVAPGEYRLHVSSIVKTSTPNPPGELFRNLKLLGYQMALVDVNKENVDLGIIEPLAQQDVQGAVKIKDFGSENSIPAGIRVRIVALELRALYSDTRPATVERDGKFVLRQVYGGNYGVRVDNVPAGHYLIDAAQQGRSVLQQGFHPGSGDLQIELAADGASVSGRVLTEDGAAIADAFVFLVSKSSGHFLAAQSDQAGGFLFATGVQPGEYRLAASANLTSWQRQDAATVARIAANGSEIRLGARESRAVDVTLRRAD
jgi:hypothetical protein